MLVRPPEGTNSCGIAVETSCPVVEETALRARQLSSHHMRRVNTSKVVGLMSLRCQNDRIEGGKRYLVKIGDRRNSATRRL